jgi:hypothetical protein
VPQNQGFLPNQLDRLTRLKVGIRAPKSGFLPEICLKVGIRAPKSGFLPEICLKVGIRASKSGKLPRN